MADLPILNNYYSGLIKSKNLTQYKLYRGVADWGKLEQFDEYESGYSFLYVVDIPIFLKILASKNQDIADLVNNYVHCLEYEFKSIDGFNDIQVDQIEISNGIEEIKRISKVNRNASTTITMRYDEKTGSVFTRFHEFFLKGIKDTATQAKSYYGLIKAGELDKGLENEVFTLLYINTDSTMLHIEKAFLFIAAQPMSANINIYESTRGEIDKRELSIEYQVYMAEGKEINLRAQKVLDVQNASEEEIVLNSEAFKYTGIDKIKYRHHGHTFV